MLIFRIGYQMLLLVVVYHMFTYDVTYQLLGFCYHMLTYQWLALMFAIKC